MRRAVCPPEELLDEAARARLPEVARALRQLAGTAGRKKVPRRLTVSETPDPFQTSV
jgi:hypothetical protein